MSKEDNELLAIVDGFIRSIKQYNRSFSMAHESQHACVMCGYRDSGFGILLSLFTMNRITSGDFHRKLHELNSALYKKIN